MTPELLALLDRIVNPDTADGGPVTDEDLAALTDADLALLRAGIGDRADELADDRTPENVGELGRAADAIERVGAVEDTRATEATERDAAAQAAIERINGRRTVDETPAEADSTDDADAPAEPERQPEPVAASGRRASLGDMNRRRAATTGTRDRQPEPARPVPSALTAAGSVPGHDIGSRFDDAYDLGGALNERFRTLGRGGAAGEQVIVASARREYPAARQLIDGDAAGNTRRLGAVTDPEAVVAAGGFCAPAPIDYGVEVVGVTDRPFRDALPGFNADRGQIQFRKNLAFTDYAGAVSTWTVQNDIDAATAGAPDPVKPCLDIACPDLSAAAVDATTLCLNFRSMTSRFDPEGTAAAIRAADIAYARFAETKLLAQARALSIDVTSPATALGGWRDLLAGLEHLIAYKQSRWRIKGLAHRAALPLWLPNLLSLDMARGMHGGATELLAPATSMFEEWLGRRNVTPVWLLDGMAAQTAVGGSLPAVAQQYYGPLTDSAALPGFPDTTSILVWAEGDFVYLDGGTLDIGVIRDQVSVLNNSYKTFMEEFNGLALRGQETYHMVAALQPRGGQAGAVDTSAFSD